MPRSKTPPHEPFRPNGFLVCYHGTGEPAAFVACDALYYSDERCQVEAGLYSVLDRERFYAVDLAPELLGRGE